MLAQHTDFLLYSQSYRVNQVKAWFRDKKLLLSASIPFLEFKTANSYVSLLLLFCSLVCFSFV